MYLSDFDKLYSPPEHTKNQPLAKNLFKRISIKKPAVAGDLKLVADTSFGDGISLRQKGLPLLSACHMSNSKELRNALSRKNTAANAVTSKPQLQGPWSLSN